MNPPVPGVEASRKVNGENHSAFPAVLMTWSSDTPCRCELGGIDQDLELALALAQDRDVRDAGHAHQTRPDGPAREDGHLDQRLAPSSSPTIMNRFATRAAGA